MAYHHRYAPAGGAAPDHAMTLVLSHRGLRSPDTPENTLEAFSKAAALGVDGFETDLRLTADGWLVLVHDRLTPGGTPVADLPYASLRREIHGHVPTLREALQVFPAALWNLEIKAPEAASPLLAVLRDFPRLRVVVTSFLHDVIAGVAAQGTVDTGLLIAHRPHDTRRFLQPWQGVARLGTVVMDYSVFSPATHACIRQEGLRTFVYGVQGRDEHARCRDLGLDAVITDEPYHLMDAG